MKGKYVWSYQDDCFMSDEYDTRESALAAALFDRRDAPCPPEDKAIYIGVIGEKWKPEIDGEAIIDMIRYNAFDECGAEIVDSDGYLENVTKEQIDELTEELTAAFNRWAEKHGRTANFFPVENIKEYQL